MSNKPDPAGGAPARHLPGHIAAALAGAGGTADSAGQPWAGRSLAGDDAVIHNFDDDDGTAHPAYLAALAALHAGTAGEEGVIASLASARVFVPIVASVAEEAAGAHGVVADKQADMALVTLQAADGRKVLPVFSSTQALADWHPQARPVAVYAARAALSAVAEGAELMVLDPGSPAPFVVRRPALWSLAQQRPWHASYADPEVAEAMAEGLHHHHAVRRLEIQPGSGVAAHAADGRAISGGGAGPELQAVLYLEDGLDAAAVQALVGDLHAAWARNVLFSERVDSIEIKIRRASQ
ncbi:SseB family protein [Pseudarthrobacter sp. J64]|uniref:SseB family protein n=1 Tax=Pseudarthrobacter sp. J64 TaxID=3116485 RepID=UPI002E816359|nr:SseB family protein [Pseudarthrobacter sp. J64]MEE2569495.1 SseB family protein [Pseudarthrobacter sp. J64]